MLNGRPIVSIEVHNQNNSKIVTGSNTKKYTPKEFVEALGIKTTVRFKRLPRMKWWEAFTYPNKCRAHYERECEESILAILRTRDIALATAIVYLAEENNKKTASKKKKAR